MSEPTQQLRTVAWGEVFPWLMLLRALRLATSAPLLLVATIAVLLMPLGWRAAAWVLPREAPVDVASQRLEAVAAAVMFQEVPLDPAVDPRARARAAHPASVPQLDWPDSWDAFTGPMRQVLTGGVEPVRHLFAADASWRELGVFAVGTLWNILVWGFFGAIIVRTAVMQFGRDERVGLVDGARFAARRYAAFVGAPLFPLALMVSLAVCAAPVGWMLRYDFGAFMASLVWIFVLLGGLLAAVVFVGLYVGWPLMWGVLSTEEMGDVFEAAQRSYSYVFGRPLHYAWYALVTLLVGSAGYVVVQWMAELTVYMSFWLVSWGSGAATPVLDDAGSWRLAGVTIIAWLSQLALTVASAFRYAYFWCALGATYLLLRRDCDQTEIDVIHVPDQPVRYTLPPLTTDAAGVPGVPGVE